MLEQQYELVRTQCVLEGALCTSAHAAILPRSQVSAPQHDGSAHESNQALPDFETLDDELRHSTRVVCRMVAPPTTLAPHHARPHHARPQPRSLPATAATHQPPLYCTLCAQVREAPVIVERLQDIGGAPCPRPLLASPFPARPLGPLTTLHVHSRLPPHPRARPPSQERPRRSRM